MACRLLTIEGFLIVHDIWVELKLTSRGVDRFSYAKRKLETFDINVIWCKFGATPFFEVNRDLEIQGK
ncbi:hypothetical protein L1987_07366 [Smallanthus sonchifolius]|uniref:Uncharacterized protein n=1 Tax=Smallanthus sonchifolius TaxID=185202 RepID=A0ACB9K0Q5_9ASTR|nr:hypothetical protein L1987_07366 [Smallanthus sonchifolius]